LKIKKTQTIQALYLGHMHFKDSEALCKALGKFPNLQVLRLLRGLNLCGATQALAWLVVSTPHPPSGGSTWVSVFDLLSLWPLVFCVLIFSACVHQGCVLEGSLMDICFFPFKRESSLCWIKPASLFVSFT